MLSRLSRQLGIKAPQIVPIQLRLFSLSTIVSALTVDKEKNKIKQLKATLKKEKDALAKLKAQHKKITQKHKDLVLKRKAEASEKKLISKALKPYRKITGLNVFIKERVGNGATIATIGKEWSYLTEAEKADFQTKADALNEENLKIWKPKPTPPANMYAAFVKEHWVNDGRDFGEVSKELASKWKEMSTLEKEAYAPSQSEKDAYAKELEQWKENRIKLYKEKLESA